jgi:hypothetical protein
MRGDEEAVIHQSVGSWRVEVVELPFRLWNANRKKPSQVSFPRGMEHDRTGSVLNACNVDWLALAQAY